MKRFAKREKNSKTLTKKKKTKDSGHELAIILHEQTFASNKL